MLRRSGLEENAKKVVQRRRLRWLGHVLRMEEGRFSRVLAEFTPPKHWKRPQGGTRTSLMSTWKRDLDWLKNVYGRVYYDDPVMVWRSIAEDRTQWKTIADKCS